MAAGAGVPPPEAVRSKGVSGGAVVLVAIVMFVAGLGVGYLVFPKAGPSAKTMLIVGTNVPFPPFEDFNTSSGEFEGFDIDIAALVAEELDRTLVVRQFASFTALLGAVGQGGVDMAASSITMSGTDGASRNQTMDFSDPYFSANQGILVQTGSSLTCTGNVCTAANLAGLTVGVQQGTTSESWLDANKEASTVVQVFQAVDAEVAALQSGTIDAVMIDYYPAVALARPAGSGLRVAGAIVTGELYGLAVPNGDPENILPKINTLIARIKTDGTYDQLTQKWFG